MVSNQQKTSFLVEVEQALKHFQDIEWLGLSSPLSSPYFLGTYLPPTAVDPIARGRVLHELLANTTEQISGRYGERYQTILRAYYFHNQSVKAVCQQINLGHNSFHLNRHEAINALSELLIKQMNPALRLETPPQHGPLQERSTIIRQSVDAIRLDQSITILGSSGLGKSALGSQIALESTRPCFWYTIRTGLNDQVESLIFALGYFLHNCGSSTLWLELVAEAGNLKRERLMAVVRYALEQLSPRPLLCIDEIEQLMPAEEADHVPIIRLLESLQGQVPLLLMGLQPVIESDHFVTLTGLSIDATEDLLREANYCYERSTVYKLYEYTQGNPRLLELCVMLLSRNESINDLLDVLSVQPSVEFLLSRILQRLTNIERAIVMELAIFQKAAPEELWSTAESKEALLQLTTSRLLYYDQQGGVMLLPIYRALLVRRIPENKRRSLHIKVAGHSERYGDYTTAAYHLIAAGRSDVAVQLWYSYRHSQINQGQAQRALKMFRDIVLESLSKTTQEMLTLARAELLHLAGNVRQSIEDIDAILWQTPLLTLEARYLQGRIANDASDFTAADAALSEALEIGESIVGARLSNVHGLLGWRHLRERKIEEAQREAQLARYELEQFEGEIQREIANYTEAAVHYNNALAIVQQLADSGRIAKTANSLAVLHLFQGDTELTKEYLNLAAEHYEQLGKVIPLASLQINWAVVHNLAGEFHDALAAAKIAHLRLSRFGNIPPRQEALIWQAMAEAHLGLGNLNEAAEYVQQVIDLEEIDLFTDAYCTFGQIQAQRGQWEEAIEMVNLSIRMATQNQDSYYIGYGWRILGDILVAAARIDEARIAYQEAIDQFESINLASDCTKIEAKLNELR